jgi:hypothetical protein
MNEQDSEEIVKYRYAQRKTPMTERLNQASSVSWSAWGAENTVTFPLLIELRLLFQLSPGLCE